MRFILRHFLNLYRGLKRNDLLVVFFILFYLVFFTSHAVIRGNYEFIFYSLIFLLLFELGIYVHKRIQLPAFVVIGLSLLGFMHILGGNVFIDGIRLYDKVFLLGTVRYDNVIHFIGSILGTFVLNEIFCFLIEKKTIIERRLYYLSLFLMALGVGLINEIVELVAVVFLNAQEGVGGYLNNAIDLVYNSIGVIVAIIILDLNYQYRLGKLKKLRGAIKFIKSRILGRL